MKNIIARIASGLTVTKFNSPARVLKNKRGMTLIEIMIVIGIIAGLMAILAPKFMGQGDKAKLGQAKIIMSQVGSQLAMYKNDCGKYPESLENLVTADASCTNWGPEAYLKKEQLLDPWKNPFSYSLADGEFTLMSLGKDGRPGGDGYGKDISYEN